MRRVVALSLTLLVACTNDGGREPTRTPQGPPNVLIVVTDDQRLDGTMAVLPEVEERIGARGVTFVNSFATTPLCCPSRASIFTGRYAHNHGVLKNTEPEVLDQNVTLQRYLEDEGYRTAFYGKYFNAWEVERNPPHFDDWAIWKSGYRRWDLGTPQGVRTGRGYSTRYVQRRALDFLRAAEANDAEPWLLYLSTSAIHQPFTAEARYADAPLPRWRGNAATRERDVGDKLAIPGRAITRAQGARLRAQQLRALMPVDDLVAAVDESLAALGEASNTLVVFTSDNGYSWGEHGILGKRTPYRESVMVPLLIRWPSHIEGPVKDERLVANIDIAPTVLDAVGIEPDAPMDGQSLLSDGSRPFLLLEQWGNYSKGLLDWAALVDRDSLFVEHYGREGTLRFRELYDLRRDPWQTVNLLAPEGRSEEAGRLHRRLRTARRCRPGHCP
jgi:arylsulfatase A-like enzyme